MIDAISKAPPYDQYGSHVPFLVRCAIRTKGPMLELGSGFYSTPVLHEIAQTMNRPLLTLDDSERWLAHQNDLCVPPHEFGVSEDLRQHSRLLKPMNADRWGLVFVDSSPAETRGELVMMLKDIADIIVCHDTEDYHDYVHKYQAAFSTFPHRVDYTRVRPYTSAVSALHDLEFLRR